MRVAPLVHGREIHRVLDVGGFPEPVLGLEIFAVDIRDFLLQRWLLARIGGAVEVVDLSNSGSPVIDRLPERGYQINDHDYRSKDHRRVGQSGRRTDHSVLV